MPKHTYFSIFIFVIAFILFLVDLVAGAAIFGAIGTAIEFFYSVFTDKREQTRK
jgi:hypothetical protein